MARCVEGRDRSQSFLLPENIDDYVDDGNPVRAVEAFVDALDLAELGFGRAVPADTGRPCYHPSNMLKIYLYGYLNRIQPSRRLEREAGRNLELMWLTGRLMPDFKTIAAGPKLVQGHRHVFYSKRNNSLQNYSDAFQANFVVFLSFSCL